MLHYAVESFEGMKAYKGKDGRLRLFRPEMNMDRLARSAARLTLPQFDKVGTYPGFWNLDIRLYMCKFARH